MSTPRACPTCLRPLDDDALFCPHDGTPVAQLRPEPADSLLGALIDGRYRVEARIGAGSVATVYRASAAALGDDVALKVLRPELNLDDRAIARFAREARATSRIAHENVVRVLDFGFATQHGLHFLVMELLDGEPLSATLAGEGRLPLPRALSILSQVALGMARAHELGVVHRDLKASNVVISRGHAKIVDFGIARVAAPGMASLTRTGELMGTPSHMAPELWACRAADARTDVYAFGVLAFEVLAGYPPFAGSSLELMEAHLQRAPPELRAVRPEIPALLSGLVARCLAKAPHERFESIGAVSEIVRTIAKRDGEVAATVRGDGALTVQDTQSLAGADDAASLAQEVSRMRRLRDRRLGELASALFAGAPPADVIGMQREIARRERELEARAEALVLADAELSELEARARNGEASLRLSLLEASLRRAGMVDVLEGALPAQPLEAAEHALASYRKAQAAELARARDALDGLVRELAAREAELAPIYDSLAQRVSVLASKRPELRNRLEAFGQVDGVLVSLQAKLEALSNRV